MPPFTWCKGIQGMPAMLSVLYCGMNSNTGLEHSVGILFFSQELRYHVPSGQEICGTAASRVSPKYLLGKLRYLTLQYTDPLSSREWQS